MAESVHQDGETERFEDPSTAATETARRIFREAAERMAGHGVPLDDIAVGMIYATQDVVAGWLGDHMEAVNWIRTAAGLQEQQLLGWAQRAH